MELTKIFKLLSSYPLEYSNEMECRSSGIFLTRADKVIG
jgi:hypothetical protein